MILSRQRETTVFDRGQVNYRATGMSPHKGVQLGTADLAVGFHRAISSVG
jgi:hypothetical protein